MEYIQTKQEEHYNVITHGLMSILMILALPFATLNAYRKIPASALPAAIGVAVFCLSLIFMFGTSAIYHGLPAGSELKRIFNRLDHMAIFFAIAGSYTPLTLIVIGGSTGLAILILEWILVLAGVIFKAVAFKKNRLTWVISILLYLMMGWAIVICLPVFIHKASPACSSLIIAGGIFYTGGLVFFAQTRRYAHVIWHFFVNAGAICHFAAIVFFMR